MPKRDTPDHVLERLEAVPCEVEVLKMLSCPHCPFRWLPKRAKEPKFCPRCHRSRFTDQGDILRERKKVPNLFTMHRFTPAAMKGLIEMKLYSYAGPPEHLPRLTFGRQRQRAANLSLTDRYLKSPLNISDFARALKIERQGAFMRIGKGFDIMLERGCFRLTAKGRENVSRGKLKAEKRTAR